MSTLHTDTRIRKVQVHLLIIFMAGRLARLFASG